MWIKIHIHAVHYHQAPHSCFSQGSLDPHNAILKGPGTRGQHFKWSQHYHSLWMFVAVLVPLLFRLNLDLASVKGIQDRTFNSPNQHITVHEHQTGRIQDTEYISWDSMPPGTYSFQFKCVPRPPLKNVNVSFPTTNANRTQGHTKWRALIILDCFKDTFLLCLIQWWETVMLVKKHTSNWIQTNNNR